MSTMEEHPSKFDHSILKLYRKFEKIIAVAVSVILAIIILFAFVRIAIDVFNSIAVNIDQPSEILYEDYQSVFGKVMTLLISLEFMSSVINIIKSHNIKRLLEDVVLIAALAIARKLIVYDYEHHEAMSIIGLGVMFLCLGIFYFFLRYERRNTVKK